MNNPKFVVLEKRKVIDELFKAKYRIITRAVLNTKEDAVNYVTEYNNALKRIKMETEGVNLAVISELFIHEVQDKPYPLRWEESKLFDHKGNVIKTSIAIRLYEVDKFDSIDMEAYDICSL